MEFVYVKEMDISLNNSRNLVSPDLQILQLKSVFWIMPNNNGVNKVSGLFFSTAKRMNKTDLLDAGVLLREAGPVLVIFPLR